MRSSLLAITIFPMLLVACKQPRPLEKSNSPGNGWGDHADEIATLQALNVKLTDAYEREDITLLREMLSDEHYHNNVFGSRLTKDEFLKDIETGVLVFESYNTPEIEWFVTDDMAVATGLIEASAIRAGKPVPAKSFRFTRIYHREGGEWKVLLFQNAMVQATPPIPES